VEDLRVVFDLPCPLRLGDAERFDLVERGFVGVLARRLAGIEASVGGVAPALFLPSTPVTTLTIGAI